MPLGQSDKKAEGFFSPLSFPFENKLLAVEDMSDVALVLIFYGRWNQGIKSNNNKHCRAGIAGTVIWKTSPICDVAFDFLGYSVICDLFCMDKCEGGVCAHVFGRVPMNTLSEARGRHWCSALWLVLIPLRQGLSRHLDINCWSASTSNPVPPTRWGHRHEWGYIWLLKWTVRSKLLLSCVHSKYHYPLSQLSSPNLRHEDPSPLGSFVFLLGFLFMLPSSSHKCPLSAYTQCIMFFLP